MLGEGLRVDVVGDKVGGNGGGEGGSDRTGVFEGEGEMVVHPYLLYLA